MEGSDNVIDFPSPDADPVIPGARWRSAEEREAFIAEHDRRTAAGESLRDLPIPIVFPMAGTRSSAVSGSLGVLLLIGAAILGTATLVVVSGDPPRWVFAAVTGMTAVGLLLVFIYANRKER